MKQNTKKDEASPIPQLVQHRLRQLVYKHTNGIWESQLEQYFQKMFKTNLNYQDYGCCSILHLCTRLPNIFRIQKHLKGNFKVSDVRLPELGELVTKDDLVYPSGVLNDGQVIKTLSVLPFIDNFCISICDSFDLSKFWFHCKESVVELKALTERLNCFYTASKDYYKIERYQLKTGLYCAALYMGDYHRSVIVDILPNSNNWIKVFFIDYGSTDYVQMEQVLFLHECFDKPPALAVRGCLANVQPKGTNMPWSMEAHQYFLQLMGSNTLKAVVKNIESMNIYHLELINEQNNAVVNINDRLVAKGYAIKTSCKQDDSLSERIFLDNKQQMHLVPPFNELEEGVFPNYKQMKMLHEEQHSIFPFYYRFLVEVD